MYLESSEVAWYAVCLFDLPSIPGPTISIVYLSCGERERENESMRMCRKFSAFLFQIG